MELVNRTAFPAAAFGQFDMAGALDAIVAVSGSFVIVPGGPLRVAAYQQPFQWIDDYDGDPQTMPLLRQGDLVPFKPGTDVTVLGDAHCPASSFDPGAAHWRCGL